MKKFILTGLLLLSLLITTTRVALAGSAMELLEVKNDAGGPTFIFRVIGTFSRAELDAGFVSVSNGDDYPLYCTQIGSDLVLCHTSRKVGGHDMVVGFGGARFWVSVPEPIVCTPVYDYSYPSPSTSWQLQGSYCNDGEILSSISFYSPYWGEYYDYYFSPGVNYPGWENPGEGYYYSE
jgi:hypothetical protein